MTSVPAIIQGGLGVGVSNWRLARAVSECGQLGVVSGTALDQVFVRRLQDGDPGGDMRHGLDHFPFPAMAERIWQRWYVEGGKAADRPYRNAPLQSANPPRELTELYIAANFVEVFLAREGHGNDVGVNFMEKLQPPHLASIYGAMLGGVGYILMGAGIPMKIPLVLDQLSRHQPAAYPLHVTGTGESDELMTFDPAEFLEGSPAPLRRPYFLPIVASNTLAVTLAKKANGRVDGFIIEGPTAGGHNAPPRGQLRLTEEGEPMYGDRDRVDFAKIAALGLPFWIAGGYGSAEGLKAALREGASGVQVGTAFAFCEESGMNASTKAMVIEQVKAGNARIFTDPLASPTGFPFKVAGVPGTLSEPEVYEARHRVCDLGYLREAYRKADGGIGFRCPAEPEEAYKLKGGPEEDVANRKCICNGLFAAIGLGQLRGKYEEPPVVTAGDDLTGIGRFLTGGATSYHARDVIDHLLGRTVGV